jgi:filamentous hemagglutinin family protein
LSWSFTLHEFCTNCLIVKRLLTTTTIAGALALCLTVDSANALPTRGQVRAGQVSISPRSGRTTVRQTSERGIIDWDTFNVASGETVQFIQPNASAITLNRINDMSPSVIDGTITANGQVWLINPQGIAFGKSAQVNVSGLLATTSDISNSDFMAGNYNFRKPGNPTATISNEGVIITASSGVATLAGPNVSNSGIITASLGRVQLASGDAFTIDLYGDGLINLQASPAITQQLITNSGVIIAEGGQVLLTAAAAESVVNSLINMSGVVDADTPGAHQGSVTITAGNGKAEISGTISVTGQTGGNVTVTGNTVDLQNGSLINASGQNGGGYVKVGGDFHGQGSTPTAQYTTVESDATIDAGATVSGDGGKVAVWSDNTTVFDGTILARGGLTSGNGGYVETSGHTLFALGTVDAGATKGSAGTWLLDPTDITINQGNCTSSCTGATNIGAALATSNVTVTATGNLTLSDNVTITDTGTGNTTLTFNAGADILIGNGTAISESGTGKLNVTFDADTAVSGGAIFMNAGSSISTHGGDIVMGGQSTPLTQPAIGDSPYGSGISLTAASLSAGAGNITLNGQGYAGTGGNQYGVQISDGNVTVTGTGNISICGTGGGSSSDATGQDVGVYITSHATVESTGSQASTANGTITIQGTGGDAAGSGHQNYGVYIGDYNDASGGTLSSVDGNVSITGTGGNSSGSSNNGLVLGTDSLIQATGNAAMYMSGVAKGASSGGYANGVVIEQGTTVSVKNGTLSIFGQGDTSDSGGYDDGVNMGPGTVETTGTGNISITGTGGGSSSDSTGGDLGVDIQNSGNSLIQSTISNGGAIIIQGMGGDAGGSGGNNIGVGLAGASVTAVNGNISITSLGGGMSIGWTPQQGTNAVAIGGNATAGTISLVTDSVSFAAGTTIETSGNIGVKEYTANTTIGVGTGAGTLSLTDTYLGYFTFGSGNTFTIGDANAGNITINSANTLLNTGSVTYISGGQITVAGNISKTAGPTDTVTLQAGTNITQNYAIGGASGYALNVEFDADSANGTSGYIASHANITTWGGNIVMGGGNSTISADSGFAIGNDGSNNQGLYIGSAVNAGGGNIIMNGQGGTNSGGLNAGIYVYGGSVTTSGSGNVTLYGTGEGLTTDGGVDVGVYVKNTASISSGNGTITIVGVAGDGGASNNIGFGTSSSGTNSVYATGTGNIFITGTAHGIDPNSPDPGVTLNSTAGNISSAGGNISITGYGTTTGTSGGDNGVVINDAITTTGVGTITITGTGGTASTGSNYGVNVKSGGNITAGSGSISIIGIGGSGGSSDYGIVTDTSGDKIGGSGYSGNITLQADSVSFGTSTAVASTGGHVLIEPYTANTSVNVAGNSTGLGVTTTYLGYISAGSITIGNAGDTGSMALGAQSWSVPVNFVTGNSGSISVAGMQTGTGNATISFTGPTTLAYAGTDVTTNNGAITFNSPVTLSAAATVNSGTALTTFGSTIDGTTSGNQILTVSNSGGSVLFSGNVGGNVSLGSLSVAGNATVDGNVTTSNAQTYNSPVTLGGNDTLATSNSNVTFSGAVNGAYGLTVAAGSGNVTFNSTVGNSAALSSLSVTGPTTLDANVTTSGVQTYNSAVTLGGNDTLTTNNSNISFNSTLTLGTAATINSGSGTTAFGTVNGDYNLTGTAGTFSLGGAWGAITPLAAVSLTCTNALTLPAVSAVSIFAETTGATANLTLNGVLNASGTGTPVILVAGQNFVNSYGSSVKNLTGGGSPRWLIYSTSPGSDASDGLTPANTVFDQTYTSDPPGSVTQSGNVWVYSTTGGTITLTAGNQTMQYGGSEPTLTYNFSCSSGCTQAASLTGLPSLSTTGNSTSNVGTYAISIAAGNLALTGSYSGYTIDYVAGVLTINTAPLTITAKNVSGTYGSVSLNGTSGFTTSGLLNSDAVSSVTLSTNASTSTSGNWNVGTWTITPSVALGSGLSNYSITYDNASTGLTVAQKALAISGLSGTNKQYDSTDSDSVTGNATLSGLVQGLNNGGGTSDVVTLSNGNASFANPNVGTGKTVSFAGYTISGTDAGNYNLSQPASSTANITAANLTVTATGGMTKTYGAADPTFTYSYSGLLGGDTSSVFSGALSRSAGQNVGSYAIAQGSLSAGGNYAIDFTGASFTINPATLTVSAANASKTYGAALPMLNYGYSGLENGDSASVFTGTLSTVATAASNVGQYAISQGSLSAGSNYTIEFNAAQLTINPARLIIAANNQSITYGMALPALTASYQGLVNGNSPAVVSGLNLQTTAGNAGTDSIVASGASASNYSITYANGTLTVNPAQLFVTADNQSRAQGKANPPLAFSYAGLVGGDTSSVFVGALTTLAGINSPAGSYAIGQGSLSAGENYHIDYLPGILTVTSIPTDAASNSPMPVIVSILGQANNYINPTLIIERTAIEPVSIIYLGDGVFLNQVAPTAGKGPSLPERPTPNANPFINCDGILANTFVCGSSD